MARVTVEFVDKVPNRFELVMLAAHRAREISSGSSITVERDNDKNPVVSLKKLLMKHKLLMNCERLIEQSSQIEVDLPEDDNGSADGWW